MDLCGRGWFRDEELWRLRSALKEMDEAILKRRKPYSPEIALVLDEESLMMNGWDSGRAVWPLLNRTGLERCGAPYGQYLLDDVLRNPPDAKLFILAYARDLSVEKQAKLDALKKREGVHVFDVKKASDLHAGAVAAEAKKAGVHLYAPAGSAFVCAAEGYVAVQALRQGPIRLNFTGHPVVDVLSGRRVSETDEVDLRFQLGETRIFKILK
jgi:hypothetical protein